MRLISVVMGEESDKQRNEDTIKQLNYGFVNFKIDNIIYKDKFNDFINIKYSKNNKTPIVLKNDINVVTRSNEKNKYSYKVVKNEVSSPINKNEVVGKLILYKNKTKINEYNLYINDYVKKANILELFIRNFKYLISGNN